MARVLAGNGTGRLVRVAWAGGGGTGRAVLGGGGTGGSPSDFTSAMTKDSGDLWVRARFAMASGPGGTASDGSSADAVAEIPRRPIRRRP